MLVFFLLAPVAVFIPALHTTLFAAASTSLDARGVFFVASSSLQRRAKTGRDLPVASTTACRRTCQNNLHLIYTSTDTLHCIVCKYF